jgi:hypothetical protein
MAHWYTMIYLNPQTLFVLRLAENFQQESLQRIICQENRQNNPNLAIIKDKFGMLAVAKHNCRRDKK